MARRERSTAKLDIGEVRQALGFFLGYYKPYRLKALTSVFAMTLTASVGLIFPSFVGAILDSILNPERIGYSTGHIVGLLFALLILQASVRYFFSLQLARITENVIAQLRGSAFGHILRLPMTFFSERRVGELQSRLSSDLEVVHETFSFTMMEFVRQALFLVGGLAFIMSVSSALTIPILSVLPFVVIIGVVFGNYIRRLSTSTQDALASATVIVEESLQAMSAVKSFQMEDHEANRYTTALNSMLGIALRSVKMRNLFISFILFTFFAGLAALLWYGAHLVHTKTVSLGEFTQFVLYAMLIGGALGSFAEIFAQVQKALGAGKRIQEILQLPQEDLRTSPQPRIVTSVALENVTFRYPSRPDVDVLRGVSLRVASGEHVAFVGESGAGKSTCAALLQRFYQPNSGQIIFDGLGPDEIDTVSVRRNIGFVPQDIALFGGTIADNIRYGKQDASDEEVRQAAIAANAAEFIERFPDKYMSLVGERGIQVSGGQRQRIAIARAILKNPPILILDEATSSLDAESESLIGQALERLMENRTTIIIAHRLSTVRRCDKIYVFSGGTIVEEGTHQQLIERPNGHYARLSALQFVDA